MMNKLQKKITDFWEAATSILMTEAVGTSETSVSFYKTTRCNIPEGSHLHIRRRKNLKYFKRQKTLLLTRN
jgi:hypothetical protein